MSFEIVKAFYGKLRSDSTFNTGLGGSASSAGRIFEALAPDGAAYPLCTFNLVTMDRDARFTSTGVDSDFNFRVDLYDRRTVSTETLYSLSDKLITLMHKASFAITDNGTGESLVTSDGQLLIEDEFNRISHNILVLCGP